MSWDDWLGKVDAQVDARLARTSVSNIEGYELWNEPDWTWDTAAAGDFNAGWARTFRRVRAKDPVTPIIGPSLSWYNAGYLRSFLTYARDNGVLPDIVCWHELAQDPSAIAGDVAAYRELERSLGISPRRIAVNEYAGTAAVDQPGTAASFIAKLERGGVDSADRAFWYEYGTLNGLVTNGRPTGTYWLYKWYGDMAGNMVATTPAGQAGLDGFASYDGTRKIVNVVVGHESGEHRPRHRAERARHVGPGAAGVDAGLRRHTAVAAPTAVWDRTYAVRNGEISVPVTGMDANSAYHLVIEPTGGVPAYQQRYEAENASVYRAERLLRQRVERRLRRPDRQLGRPAQRQLRRLHRGRPVRPDVHDDDRLRQRHGRDGHAGHRLQRRRVVDDQLPAHRRLGPVRGDRVHDGEPARRVQRDPAGQGIAVLPGRHRLRRTGLHRAELTPATPFAESANCKFAIEP